MLSDEQIDAVIEAAENAIGMGHRAWDMVNPRELVRAIESALSQSTEQGEREHRRVLPHPGSPEASAMMDSMLAEYQWPANTKNAARAGWEAANRWLMQRAAMSPHGDGGRG
jgi:hypothetical protein